MRDSDSEEVVRCVVLDASHWSIKFSQVRGARDGLASTDSDHCEALPSYRPQRPGS